MKSSIFSALAVSSILLGSNALAQVNPNSSTSTGNVSGNAGGAPASLNVDFYKLGTFLSTRIHTLSLDALSAGMQLGTQKKYLAGFSAEGALVYQYELDGEDLSDWNETGRNAGMQLLPFSIAVMPNGMKKVSFSAVAFRNMNTLANTENGDSAWKVFDRLDLLTFTWDQNMTFNNLRTFDLTVLNTNLKLGLVKNKANTSYLALRGGGNFGLRQTQIADLQTMGYEQLKIMSGAGELGGGLELNLQARSGVRLNMQSNYVYGGSRTMLRNTSVDSQNAANTQAYNSDYTQYSLDSDAWLQAKSAYEVANTGGTAISDESYAALSGTPKPVAPGEPDSMNAKQKLNRNYGYLKNSIDLSIPLKHSGRPVRLGVGMDVNVVFFDQAVNKNRNNFGSAAKIDFTGNYNQALRGRLYLNF